MQRYMTNQPLDEFTSAHIQTPFTPKLIYTYSLESAEGINPVATLPSRRFTNSVVRKTDDSSPLRHGEFTLVNLFFIGFD
jgi:hypothetical protein